MSANEIIAEKDQDTPTRPVIAAPAPSFVYPVRSLLTSIQAAAEDAPVSPPEPADRQLTKSFSEPTKYRPPDLGGSEDRRTERKAETQLGSRVTGTNGGHHKYLAP